MPSGVSASEPAGARHPSLMRCACLSLHASNIPVTEDAHPAMQLQCRSCYLRSTGLDLVTS